MLDWLESIAGPQYVPAVLWTLAALAALVAILIVVKVVRRASSGTFVAGGRNRKTRLAVMDATAVDSHRRLVLVRRDDVEHLLLIGGTTDIVVEQNIRLNAPVRRPAPAERADQAPVQRPRPPEAPAQPPQAPQPRPVQPPVATQRPPTPLAPPAAQRPQPAVAPQPRQVVAPPPAKIDDFDETLLQELEVSLDSEREKNVAKRPEASLEEEMTRLLGELSAGKK